MIPHYLVQFDHFFFFFKLSCLNDNAKCTFRFYLDVNRNAIIISNVKITTVLLIGFYIENKQFTEFLCHHVIINRSSFLILLIFLNETKKKSINDSFPRRRGKATTMRNSQLRCFLTPSVR